MNVGPFNPYEARTLGVREHRARPIHKVGLPASPLTPRYSVCGARVEIVATIAPSETVGELCPLCFSEGQRDAVEAARQHGGLPSPSHFDTRGAA